MKSYKNISDYTIEKGAVVTIGTFDGVHQGHQKILSRVTEIAGKRNLTSILLTFFPHPRMVLQPDNDLQLINTIEERKSLVFNTGIEHIITHPFSREFARTTAHEYVKNILVDQLNAKVVVIGYDHRFGRNRAASVVELLEYAKEYDFEVVEISKKEVEEVAVSSTKVRNAIIDGDLQTVTRYLNRPYSIYGTVVTGKQLGRTLGYPTANLKVAESYKLLPKNGVYVTSAVIEGATYYGMTNIGTNPTVDKGLTTTIETYFFDFMGDLYDFQLDLSFHKRLRDEVQFKSLELLQKAMNQDELNARNYAQQLG